jgi:hypothetical protein
MHSDEMTTALAKLERALNRLVDTQIRLAGTMEAASEGMRTQLDAFQRTVLSPTDRGTCPDSAKL